MNTYFFRKDYQDKVITEVPNGYYVWDEIRGSVMGKEAGDSYMQSLLAMGYKQLTNDTKRLRDIVSAEAYAMGAEAAAEEDDTMADIFYEEHCRAQVCSLDELKKLARTHSILPTVGGHEEGAVFWIDEDGHHITCNGDCAGCWYFDCPNNNNQN